MDTVQILGWANSFLLGIIGFLCKSIWDDVKTIKKDVQARTLKGDCIKIHDELAKSIHKHALSGTAGEVVK